MSRLRTVPMAIQGMPGTMSHIPLLHSKQVLEGTIKGLMSMVALLRMDMGDRSRRTGWCSSDILSAI